MREMIKMVLVIAILSSFSGGLLAGLRIGTKDRIEMQQLAFVKGPAIKSILKDCSNNPIMDRFKIQDGDIERSFFVGIKDGKPDYVAFEEYGKGFGGDIGVMVGVNLTNDQLIGIGVTTHSETPGLGSKAKTEPGFAAQFIGRILGHPIKVKSNGGKIDALTGATITSAGVCSAVRTSGNLYKRIKSKILQKVKSLKKKEKTNG